MTCRLFYCNLSRLTSSFLNFISFPAVPLVPTACTTVRYSMYRVPLPTYCVEATLASPNLPGFI